MNEQSKAPAPAGFKGRFNIYTCENCGGRITSLDRDEGVTPFMIRCIVKRACPGMMMSACYRPRPELLQTPAIEWIDPSPAELVAYLQTIPKRHHQGIREHVAKGGLIMREVTRQ